MKQSFVWRTSFITIYIIHQSKMNCTVYTFFFFQICHTYWLAISWPQLVLQFWATASFHGVTSFKLLNNHEFLRLEHMNFAISRSGSGYPPSAAWYPGVSTGSLGAQPVPTSTPQWLQQGPVGVQNYPPSTLGSIPVDGPKMECVSGTMAIRNCNISSVRHMCVNLSQFTTQYHRRGG